MPVDYSSQRIERYPIVGVMGSGRSSHNEFAEPLGRWLGEHEFHLLTGGGRGVMESVSRAFVEVSRPPRVGLSLGISPGRMDAAGGGLRRPEGYPNPFIEIPIQTHLPLSGEEGLQPLSRNHINILSSDVVVALPGSAGTESEKQLARAYQKPLFVLDSVDLLDDAFAFIVESTR